MSRAITDLKALQTRLAYSANMALDAAGYPMNLRDRVRLLSDALRVDVDTCKAFLQGTGAPDWQILLNLCKLTNRQLGWFLDPSETELPTGTYTVNPLTTGESLVIRLPNVVNHDLGSGPPEIYYLVAKKDMGFGINASDYVFVIAHKPNASTFQINSLYLISDDEGHEALKCSSGDSERAVFRSLEPERSRILSVRNLISHEKRTSKNGEYFCGVITAILRSTDVLPAPKEH